ncbi:MAG: ABC transporter permease, partial [Mariprofundales bacterium]
MYKLIAACRKEMQVLLRDKPGLAMLFLMPMALVLIITLIQNNILETSNQPKMKMIMINLDQGGLGNALEKGLVATDFFELIEVYNDLPLTETLMHKLIAKGEFQAGIIIPEDASRIQQNKVSALMANQNPMAASEKKTVALLFDPNIQHSLHLTVLSMVTSLIQTEKLKLLLAELQFSLKDILPAADNGKEYKVWSSAKKVLQQDASDVEHTFAIINSNNIKPNAVQHNVPGWTMFAIFFISLPLAAGLIKERNEGTLERLRTLPVSITNVFLGKIITYSMISIFQLILMLMIGKFILPLFGTPVLDLGDNPELILIVGLCAGLAACGLGILFGMMAKNYEQVASAGPIVIVIAAAIGGIMIPVFMMPEFIQPLSNISPLHWGHEAFIDIFLRGSDIGMLLPNLAKLIAF